MISVITLTALVLSTPLWGQSGQAIFDGNNCSTCHQATGGSALGPSLKTIARTYNEKGNGLQDLILYLKSDKRPIVQPGKSAMMQNYLNSIKGLSNKEFRLLGKYIMDSGK
jgi:cytochrome c551/c552